MTNAKQSLEKWTVYYLIFAAFFYSYIYFFSFNQGNSAAPLFFPLGRDFLFALLAGLSLYFTPDKFFLYRKEPILVIFLLFILLTALLSPSFVFLKETKNILLYSFGFIVATNLTYKNRQFTLFLILVVQCLFSYIGYEYNIGWGNWKICGTFGNPNIFAIFLNLSIFFLILEKNITKLSYINLILSVGLLLFTKSSAGIIIFLSTLILTIAHLIFQRRFIYALNIFFVSTITIIATELIFGVIFWHFWIVFYNEILSFLGLSQYALSVEDYILIIPSDLKNAHFQMAQGSESISGRLEQIKIFIDRFSEFPQLRFWIGELNGPLVGDIQYVYLFIHHGFVALCLFLYLQFKMLFNCLYYRHFLPFILTLIFSLGFIFYRLLYYFPLNMLFFMLCYYTLVKLPEISTPKNRQTRRFHANSDVEASN